MILEPHQQQLSIIQQQQHSKKILILGGTNFMGKTLVDFLSTSWSQFQLILINRGKSYWNNQSRKLRSNIETFYADRKQHKDFYNMIEYLNDKYKITKQNKWKAVVDFSGFKWRDLQSVVKGVKNKCGKYVYLSTDSVYNNVKDDEDGMKNGDSSSHSYKKNKQGKLNLPIRQDQFDIQLQYNTQRKQQQINDKYGYNKLKCQLYLKKRCQYYGIPFFSLRLPDVIGPYDNSDRFWTTYQWIKQSFDHPIPLTNEDQIKPLSFVFSYDVAKFIIQLINMQENGIKSDFINVACRENPSFEEFVRLMAKKMKINVNFKAVKKNSNNCYPSTEFGHVDVGKLTEKYGFQPTKLEQGIAQSVIFFTQKAWKYSNQRKQMMRMLNKKLKGRQQ